MPKYYIHYGAYDGSDGGSLYKDLSGTPFDNVKEAVDYISREITNCPVKEEREDWKAYSVTIRLLEDGYETDIEVA